MYCVVNRYLPENHDTHWEITDSEILAGIDGLLLSQQIGHFTQRINRIRLSQVLDMYYSGRGLSIMAFETTNFKSVDDEWAPTNHRRMAHISVNEGISSACDRRKILQYVDREKLKDETFHFAQILQLAASGLTVNDDILRIHCDAAVGRFFDNAGMYVNSLFLFILSLAISICFYFR